MSYTYNTNHLYTHSRVYTYSILTCISNHIHTMYITPYSLEIHSVLVAACVAVPALCICGLRITLVQISHTATYTTYPTYTLSRAPLYSRWLR